MSMFGRFFFCYSVDSPASIFFSLLIVAMFLCGPVHHPRPYAEKTKTVTTFYKTSVAIAISCLHNIYSIYYMLHSSMVQHTSLGYIFELNKSGRGRRREKNEQIFDEWFCLTVCSHIFCCCCCCLCNPSNWITSFGLFGLLAL